MHISEAVFKNKPIFYFILVCLFVGGIMSYRSISKLEDPEIKVSVARVITVYPGASAHEVEMQVTDVLEEEISALADIESIKSKSVANLSALDVKLKMSIPQAEIDMRWELLRRKLELAQSKLPSGAQTPLVFDDIGDVYGMFYAMTADGFTHQEMAEQADFIKRGLLEVEGVRKVQVYGIQESVVNIELSSEKMSEMGIFPIQIMSAIQGQNKLLYSGSLQSGDQQIRVAVNERMSSIEDLENLLIRDLEGNEFKLSDFAKITKGFKEPARNTFFVNNEKAIGISASMESGENIVKVGERVDEKMTELQKDLPVGYEFSKVFFQPDQVSGSIKGFVRNLMASVIVVILILMVTMGLRGGIIIGSSLLLTIMATFPFLLLAGGSMHRISFGAFILAMGMLVDNAIVIIDGIMVDLQTGRRRKSSFINTAKKTAMPLLGATLIAAFTFLPVAVSKDAAGTYAGDLFVVLCISLLISWVLAMTQVPIFSAGFLRIPKKKKNKDPFEGKSFQIFSKFLTFVVDHKVVAVIIITLLMAGAGYGFLSVKQTFFPDMLYNQVYIEYKLPYGTNPDKVNEDLAAITDEFKTYDEVKLVATSQGMTPTRYCFVRPIGEMGDNYGELIVNFTDYNTMVKMKPVLEKHIRDNYPDAMFRIRKYNLSIASSHIIELEFTGPDPAVLKKLSEQTEDIMRNNPYVNKYTVCNDWEPMGKTLMAKYNQILAGQSMTGRSDVSNALLAATDGLPLGNIYEGETPIGINLMLRNDDGSRIEKLEDIPVWNMIPNLQSMFSEDLMMVLQGVKKTDDVIGKVIRPVPLSAVTDGVDMEWEEMVVRRNNGKRAIQAQCDPLEDYAPAFVRENLAEEIEKSIELPEGYNYHWAGEFEMQGRALSNIFRFLPVVLMLMIIILILLFNDFKRPIIVFACIPLAFLGIVPGLLISGQPFTFMAVIGSFGLMGMLVKNSIVLLDEISIQLKHTRNRYQAVIKATIMRTRPVIMASFTTILGMLPLFSDPMYKSMAVTIISGLLIGTIVTLVFVPVFYATFYGIHKNENIKILTD